VNNATAKSLLRSYRLPYSLENFARYKVSKIVWRPLSSRQAMLVVFVRSFASLQLCVFDLVASNLYLIDPLASIYPLYL